MSTEHGACSSSSSSSRWSSKRLLALCSCSRGLLAPCSLFALAVSACASRPRDPVLDAYPRDVNGQTTVMYYDVHGSTVAELRADMRRQGPKVGDSSFVGETRSPMRWNWRTHPEGTSACSFYDVRVYVNAQILLPHWVPPADTEPGLAVEWTRFMAALEAHEAGHKNISAKAASEIIKQVGALSGSCSVISARASDITRAIVARASDEQKRYDAETRHGITQGTAFGIRRVAVVPPESGRTFALPYSGAVLASRPGTIRAPLSVSMDVAWHAVPAAYTAVGLTVTMTDSASRVVASTGPVHQKIGETALSTLFDCGSPPADVSLIAAAQLSADAEGKIWIMIVSNATTRSDAGATTMCRSNSRLERQILEALRAELAR